MSWAGPAALVVATGPVVLCLGLPVVWAHTGGTGPAAWWLAAAPAVAAVALAAAGATLRRPAPRPLLLLGVLVGVELGSLLSRLFAGRHPGSPSAGRLPTSRTPW